MDNASFVPPRLNGALHPYEAFAHLDPDRESVSRRRSLDARVGALEYLRRYDSRLTPNQRQFVNGVWRDRQRAAVLEGDAGADQVLSMLTHFQQRLIGDLALDVLGFRLWEFEIFDGSWRPAHYKGSERRRGLQRHLEGVSCGITAAMPQFHAWPSSYQRRIQLALHLVENWGRDELREDVFFRIGARERWIIDMLILHATGLRRQSFEPARGSLIVRDPSRIPEGFFTLDGYDRFVASGSARARVGDEQGGRHG